MAVCLALGLVSLSAVTGITASAAVGNVGDEAELRDAVGSGGSGDVILSADFNDDAPLEIELLIERSLTLDLNGQTLTINVDSGNGIKIGSGFTLTIIDSVGGSLGGALSIDNSATTAAAGQGAGINVSDGTLIINSGVVEARGGAGAAGIGGGEGGAGGNIAINGGEILAIAGEVGNEAAIGRGDGGDDGVVTIDGIYHYWLVQATAPGIARFNGEALSYANENKYLHLVEVAPTVTVGTQAGALTAGTAGNVSFTVTTTSIPNGSHLVTVSSLPGGITAPSNVSINDNVGTLMLSGDATTTHGISSLTFTFSGIDITSEAFTLTIGEALSTPPAAPGNFTATAGDAQVVLTWTTPSNGGSAITGYELSYGMSDDYVASWTSMDGSSAGTTTYTVTGLTNETEYTFEIRAVNFIGSSDSSGITTATPTSAAPPPPVITIDEQPAATTTVTASSISGSLSVTASVEPSGALLSYQWFINDDPSNTDGNALPTNATSATFQIPQVLEAGTYYFYVIVSAPGAVSVTSDVATVIVNEAPQFINDLGPQTVNIAAPATGATPQATVTGLGYEGVISWEGSPATFLAGRAYTATVTLTSLEYYQWPSDAPTITVTGSTSVVDVTVEGTGSGNILTFTVTFARTADSFGITVSPMDRTFPTGLVGYNNVAPQVFTITNTGTGTITGLTAGLGSGSAFEITTSLSPTTIGPSGTATISIRPRNGLPAGRYSGTLLITGNNGVAASVALSFEVSNVPASIRPGGNGGVHTFDEAPVGYASRSPQAFTIDNIGANVLTGLTASINNSNFVISTGLSGNTVAPGESVAISVRPRDGLLSGTHTATLTIVSGEITLTVTLSFKVYAEAPGGVRYGDLNGDGMVDNRDLILMLQYRAGLIPLNATILAALDFNGNGAIDPAEFELFMRYFAQPGVVLGPQG